MKNNKLFILKLRYGVFNTNGSCINVSFTNGGIFKILGCAFEAAEILLSHSNIDNEVSCDWLAASAQLLAMNFNNLKYVSQAEDVIWMAINRLEDQLVQHPSQALWMDQYLALLYADLKIYILMAAKGNGPHLERRESVAVMH